VIALTTKRTCSILGYATQTELSIPMLSANEVILDVRCFAYKRRRFSSYTGKWINDTESINDHFYQFIS
jgi:hypothetical protein